MLGTEVLVFELLGSESEAFLQQGISEPVFYGDLVYNSKELLDYLILGINSKR